MSHRDALLEHVYINLPTIIRTRFGRVLAFLELEEIVSETVLIFAKEFDRFIAQGRTLPKTVSNKHIIYRTLDAIRRMYQKQDQNGRYARNFKTFQLFEFYDVSEDDDQDFTHQVLEVTDLGASPQKQALDNISAQRIDNGNDLVAQARSLFDRHDALWSRDFEADLRHLLVVEMSSQRTAHQGAVQRVLSWVERNPETPATQQDIALGARICRETVSRALKELQEKGTVICLDGRSTHKKRYRLTRPLSSIG